MTHLTNSQMYILQILKSGTVKYHVSHYDSPDWYNVQFLVNKNYLAKAGQATTDDPNKKLDLFAITTLGERYTIVDNRLASLKKDTWKKHDLGGTNHLSVHSIESGFVAHTASKGLKDQEHARMIENIPNMLLTLKQAQEALRTIADKADELADESDDAPGTKEWAENLRSIANGCGFAVTAAINAALEP